MYSSFDVLIYPWSGWTSNNFALIESSGINTIFSTFDGISTCLLKSSVVKIFKRIDWLASIFWLNNWDCNLSGQVMFLWQVICNLARDNISIVHLFDIMTSGMDEVFSVILVGLFISQYNLYFLIIPANSLFGLFKSSLMSPKMKKAFFSLKFL